MTDLTFTRHTDDPLGTTWTLSGPNGAVVFGPMGIDAHSPVPMYRDGSGPHSDNCPTTHGACWVDGSSLEGRKLHDRWDNAGRDDSVIRAELERWYNEELSTPVPVSEGSQVSGEEVGPVSGVGRPDLQIAATGAGNGPGGVVPVPVAAQLDLSAIRARAATLARMRDAAHPGAKFAAMQSALDVPSLLAAQPWDPTSPQHAVIRAAIAWRNGEEVERIGVDDLGLALIEAVDALPHIGEPAAPVAAPLEPRWGSGPLVDHNLETPGTALIDMGYMSLPAEIHRAADEHVAGTGSADPDGGQR